MRNELNYRIFSVAKELTPKKKEKQAHPTIEYQQAQAIEPSAPPPMAAPMRPGMRKFRLYNRSPDIVFGNLF